jgi:chitinase
MLAIGGWNEGSRRFSPMVEDPARRQVFIKSALRFLRQYNFDGIDLDWEYPTLRAGGRPQDKDNYATFIEEMRQAFESEAQKTGKERLLISMAVPASLEYAGQGYAIDRLDQALDFFNLLTYDYHSAHEPAVNHHSPLYRPDEWSDYDFRKDLNIDTTVRFYVSHGASRHKLVLGIPTYGRSYTLANPDAHEISSPAIAPGEKGSGTKEDGYLAYYEICQKVLEEGWDLVTQYPGIMGPYAHRGDQWVGFDDVDIAVEKAFYVAEEELGGIMFWTIDNDDFRGTCSKTPYPLIESAKEAMYSVESTVKTKTSVEVSTSEQVRRTRTKLRLTEKELANLSPRYPLPNSQPYPSLLEQIAHHPRPPIPYLKPNDPYSNNWASAPLPVPSQT